MHLHVQVKHWVVVWFWIGVVCGIVALVNIFARNLAPADIKLALFFGVEFWVIGGLICYGYEGIQIQQPPTRRRGEPSRLGPETKEWHSASDFVLPGTHRYRHP